MNTNYKLDGLPAAYAEESQLDRRPAASAAFRAALEDEFERLKARLLNRELDEAATPELAAPLKRAAADAAALAWDTALPLLVFPVLFEEKTTVAMRQSNRQARLLAAHELVVA